MDERFDHDQYVVRRKILMIFGAAFHVFDPEGRVVLFSRQKAFRLKEDIRVFAGEDMREELLTMRSRHVIDFGATYDVVDATTGGTIGSLRRMGLRSLVRDNWVIFDDNAREVAQIREDSGSLAVLRRLQQGLTFLFPQAHHVEADGRTIATFRQNRNPIVHKTAVSIIEPGAVDRRLLVATAILLVAIEGRQR